MGLRGHRLIGKGKEGRTRGSEIDILGLYGGGRAGLLLGWSGVCRLPLSLVRILYVLLLEGEMLSYTRS